jgi:streptogramin lyase
VRTTTRILTVLATLLLGAGASIAVAREPSVTEYDVGLTTTVSLWGITEGPDGNVWFTEESGNAVGRITPEGVITEFSSGFPYGNPRGITTGPDGNLWVAEAGGNGSITKVTKTGVVTDHEVPTPGDPNDVAVGPDGNIWYVDPATNLVGRVTTTGSFTEFSVDPGADPTAIAKGPDGNLWFTETGSGNIGKITPQGAVTEFSSGLSGSGEPSDIVAGPDGNLWFTLSGEDAIGRITPNGDVTKFSTGLSLLSRPLGIAAGPDGALWFTESGLPGRIGRITTDGDIEEHTIGLLGITNPWFITAGADGNMWFTGNNLPSRVGRISLPPFLKDPSADQLGMASARLKARLRPNSQQTDYHFEYGRTTALGEETSEHNAGSSYDLDEVKATIGGLSPETKYYFRIVAVNDSGESQSAIRSFTTLAKTEPAVDEPVKRLEPEVVPDFTKRVVAEPDGTVRFKAPGGQWHTLQADAALPVGVALDARRGHVTLTTEGAGGGMQTGVFGGGVFAVRQPRGGRGRVDVYLRGGSFAGCPRASGGRRGGARRASASRNRKVRKLWGRDRGGKFRTHGRHSHATVRGTRWLTLDRCDGTLTRVTNGAVVVRDEVRKRRVLVEAGHSYLAKSRKALAQSRRAAARKRRR